MVLEEGSIGVARGDSRDIRRIKERALLRGMPALLCTLRFCHTHEEILRHKLLSPPKTPHRLVPGSESSENRGMRSSRSRCWVLGGKCGNKKRADEAENPNELKRHFEDTFLLVLVEVPHTRSYSVFVFVFNNSPTFLLGAAGPWRREGREGAEARRARRRGGRGGAEGARRRGGHTRRRGPLR